MRDNVFKKIIFLILFLGLMLRLLFAFLIPPLEISDGVAHFSYVTFIAEENRLPVMEYPGTEYYQAPLYYLIHGVILKIGTGIIEEFPIRMLAMIDILYGLLTIYFSYKISSLLFKNKYIILGIVTFVALLPTYAYFTAHSVNINLEVLFSTMGIYLLLLALKKESYKLLILSGIILGLGILTRASIVLLAIAGMFLFALKYYNNKRFDYKRFTKAAAIVIIFLFLTSGFWLARNFILYGDLLGTNAYPLAGSKSEYEWEQGVDWDFGLFVRYIGRIFATFWSSFGFGSHIFISLDDILPIEMGMSTTKGIISFAAVYGTLFIITLLSLLGIFLLAIKYIKKKKIFNDFQIKSFLFMSAYVIAIFASHFRISLYNYQPQGKFYFLAIVPLAIFFTLGMYRILSKFLNKRNIITLFIALFVVLNILSFAKLISDESYIGYLNKKGENLEEVETNKIQLIGRDSFEPPKIAISSGTTLTLLNNDATELPRLKGAKPENRIILLKDNNKYLTSKTLEYGEEFNYRLDKPGIYTIRRGNYGEVQAEIIVR